jgi:hypothetical protein
LFKRMWHTSCFDKYLIGNRQDRKFGGEWQWTNKSRFSQYGPWAQGYKQVSSYSRYNV